METYGHYFQYGSILLCFLIALIGFLARRRSALWQGIPWCDRYLPLLSLAATLLADTFLVLLLVYELLGVICFCLVQTLYGSYLILRLRKLRLKEQLRSLCIRLLLLGLIEAGLAAAELSADGGMDLLSAFAGYSMAMLLANVIDAWRLYLLEKKLPEAVVFQKVPLLLPLGLTLFLGCDLCVGLYNAAGYLAGMESISAIAYGLIWWFYLPSQALLTLFSLRMMTAAKDLER